MALLAEVNLAKAIPWADQLDHVWYNDETHTWIDVGYVLVSLDGFAGDRYWDAMIIDFTPPRYQASTDWGGYCKMTFGSISFSQDLFAGVGRWPPPPSFPLRLWYTETDESKRYELFDGTAHLDGLNINSVSYNLYPGDYDAELLPEKWQYSEDAEELGYTDDELIAIPRAFGKVLHVTPIRGPDDSSTRPTYYKSDITGNLAVAITSTADNGSGKVRFTSSSAHGFITGDSVSVEVNDFASTYNVTQNVIVIDSTHFDFPLIAYVDDQGGHAFITGDRKVVSAADNGSGKVRFATAKPHGYTTGDFVTVQTGDPISTYNSTQAIVVIDTTHFDFTAIEYIDSQSGQADNRAEWWAVYDDGVPISSNVVDNGDGTFSLTATPVGTVTISGTGTNASLHEIFTWACGGDRLNLIYESSYKRVSSPLLSHWASSQMVLVDFLSEISAFWKHLYYITKDILFLVDLQIDHGDRTLDESDFFPSSYSYGQPTSMLKAEWTKPLRLEDRKGKQVTSENVEVALTGTYAYGDEKSITVYSIDENVVKAALIDIKSQLDNVTMDLKIPLLGTMKSVFWTDVVGDIWLNDGDDTWITEQTFYPPPLPGERIWLTDTSMKQTMYVGVICMGIQYDFAEGIVSITGLGSMALDKDDLG